VFSAQAQQADDKATAQALFNDGRSLSRAGNFEQACPKLAESQRLDPALGTLGWLAQCFEGLGKTASAWATYREVQTLAHRGNEAEREAKAKERADALEAKLSKLSLAVPAASRVPGLEVRRNGTLVGEAVWGSPLPVDPGAQTIDVTAPGYTPVSLRVNVGANGATASATIPTLEPVPVPVVSAAPPLSAPANSAVGSAPAALPPNLAPANNAETDRRSTGHGANGQRVAGYLVSALGVVSLGIGVGYYLDKNSKESSAGALCPGPCADSATHTHWQSLIDQADSSSKISLATSIVGGAMLGTGLVLLLTSGGNDSTSSARVIFTPALARNAGGAFVEGSW
jgi:serine/threonine-protein kinase